MKIKNAARGCALGFLLTATAAFAQVNVTSTSTNSTSQSSASTSNNAGNSLTNNFNSVTPSDTTNHEHISGVTGSNTAVGLGSFASSFSSDYCGGTQQAGLSVPYATLAAGGPTMKEPGYACDDHRTGVHAMEYSATYGNAAAAANKAGNTALAAQYMDMSTKLAKFAVLMECTHSAAARENAVAAGLDFCKKTEVTPAQAQANAVANGEPTDPIIRYHEGLPALASK